MKCIKFFIVIAVATICLTACEKETYVHDIVKGRIIDKITREPVKDVMVDFNKCDDIMYRPNDSQKSEKRHKYSPIRYEGWSDENGEFRTIGHRLEKDNIPPSLLYVYGYYGNSLYKDTTILVDFSNVPLSGKPSKNYKGEYILNIGDIELEKIE